MKKEVNPVIQNDIMRFRTNKLASNLALLAVAFGCLYFLVMYGQYSEAYEKSALDSLTGQYDSILYYDISMGLSVVYNLVFLLLAFYMSIQVKNYNKTSCYIMIALAVIQIARIFWYPLQGITTEYNGSSVVPTLSFISMVLWLCLSAACLIGSAVVGYIRATQYWNYRKQLESGEIDIDAVLKQADAEEEASVANAAAKEV